MQDPYASDVLTHLSDEITGPMAQSLRVQKRALAADGSIGIDAPLREAAVFLCLRRNLAADALTVRARLQDPLRDLVPSRFQSWTEAGGALALYTPPADPETEMIAPFQIILDARLGARDLTQEETAEWLEARIVSGRTGKLLQMLQAETVAVRRHARAIAAARSLDGAEGISLDRHGTDLGMPRFRNGLRLRADGQVLTETGEENDAAYRMRLALGRSFNLPRPAHMAARLAADGPLSQIGPAVPMVLDEADNPFSVAVRLVSIDRTEQATTRRRNRFMTFLRDWVLIDPAAGLPSRRSMSRRAATQERAMRGRLREALDIQTTTADLAPELARAFDRATSLMRILGVADQLRIHRVHAPEDGSRFDLGLGAEIARPSAAILTGLADAVRAGDVPEDPEAAATFSTLQPPADVSEDRAGAWFFAACGFATVHVLSADRIYLSHTNAQSLAISGEQQAILAGDTTDITFLARFTPAGEVSRSALLLTLIDTATDALAGTTVAADPTAIVDTGLAPNATQALRIRAAGLPVVDDWPRLAERLPNLPPEDWAIIQFPNAVSQALRNGQATAWRDLGTMVRGLRDAGLSAAVPVITNTGVSLLISVIGLPGIGTNLTGKAATGIRWFVIPIDQDATAGWSKTIRGRGNQSVQIKRPSARETQIRFRTNGLYAVVALGYERRGATDPFEVRIRPQEDDGQLTFAQYEYVMNMLSMRAPAGVEINTWQLRQFHVAADTGETTPLDPTASRTFRPFLQPRRAGAPPTRPTPPE
ncbi:hypothetical protein QTO30_01560 [Yoonia sp. GPGPB17]|uniref:hypothetical protein n=1 Tax=Yoonia sp. GPGPB17 TaxID=3026147 RepID=UPI0030C07852